MTTPYQLPDPGSDDGAEGFFLTPATPTTASTPSHPGNPSGPHPVPAAASDQHRHTAWQPRTGTTQTPPPHTYESAGSPGLFGHPHPTTAAHPTTTAAPTVPGPPTPTSLPAPMPAPALPDAAPPTDAVSPGDGAVLVGWRARVANLSGGLVRIGPSISQRIDAMVPGIAKPIGGLHQIAFIGAKGGVGRTTLTAATGTVIAAHRGDRLIAVDANTENPDLADLFAVIDGKTTSIHDFSQLPVVETHSTAAQYTVQNSDRLECLATHHQPNRPPVMLDRRALHTVIGHVSRHYDMIVVDTDTTQSHPVYADIIAAAGSIVIVADTTRGGLHGAQESIRWLDAHGHHNLRTRAVVVFNTTTSGKPLVDLEDAKTQFAPEVRKVLTIGYDRRLAQGTPFTVADLDRRTQLEVTTLAAVLAQDYPSPTRHQQVF